MAGGTVSWLNMSDGKIHKWLGDTLKWLQIYIWMLDTLEAQHDKQYDSLYET